MMPHSEKIEPAPEVLIQHSENIEAAHEIVNQHSDEIERAEVVSPVGPRRAWRRLLPAAVKRPIRRAINMLKPL
jgi:hypothetical protein